MKQLKCNLNKLNLHGFIGCAITYLTKARPTLSWDQALLLVNRFSATRRMEKSCIWCNTCIPKIRWLRVFKTNKNCCMSLRRLSLFLDFRLVNVRQLHSMQRKMQHQHLGKRWWCTQVFVLTFTRAPTLRSTPGPSRPVHGHMPCILVGRTKASQECGQILPKPPLYTKKVSLIMNSLRAPLVARK